MKISFVDLKRQNQLYHHQFVSIINSVINTADFILGKRLVKFESAFAKFCGVKYCIGLNSGTDALEFALRAYNIKSGDEVITVPNSYFSTAMVISKVGARPIFIDVDPETYTMDPQKLSIAISSKTKAIIPVHLCGQTADMDPIIALAKKHNLVIIEDCCQAHGSRYKNRNVPITGTGAFSFYPGKNLGCFGDGGALVTNNSKVAKIVRYLRNDGSINKYYHQMIGSKSRLDVLQAAILYFKLKHLRRWNYLRRHHAKTYNQLLADIPLIKLPHEAESAFHTYHLYMIQARKRNELKHYLSKHGIETVIHYPIPIHLQPAYKHLGYKQNDFPITELIAKRLLSLPLFPELTNREIYYITSAIRRFYC